ncbi:MAG: DUF2934 domain-containing protein [Planctomycetota bacterium]
MARTNRVTTAKKGFTGGFGTEAKQNILPKDRTEKIRKKAYELFGNRGRLPGNDLADWFEAERAVEEEIKRGR